MATVTLEGLTRRHPGAEKPALDRLDLEVKDGELLVFVGPSGCGKSTALRLIAGLDTPDAGRVSIDGRDVTAAAPQDRDVAMVFQGYALYPHMSARDNIAFPLKMKGIARVERERRVAEIAAMLGLAKLLDRKPGELSGGERQRVAMGRAIVRRPKVFLFDEPLANLDAALRADLRVELASLVRRLGTTAIYVTHDQAEAMTMGDRIAVLRDGRLQQIAAPRTIYETPANLFVAGFLGSPPMNLIDLTLRDGVFEGGGLAVPVAVAVAVAVPVPVAVAVPVPVPVPVPVASLPARVTVGLRPEHLTIARPDHPPAPHHLSLRATVITREPLGAETHVRIESDGVTYWARVPGFDAPAIGASIEAHVDPRHLLWFDRMTGARIDLAGAPA